MKRKNYLPWAVTLDKKFNPAGLIKFGVLAPSSHNSQPWLFRVHADAVSVSLEKSRRLPKSDTNDRQSIISIGCAVANMELVADYYGYLCMVENACPGDVIATLRLKPKEKDGDECHTENIQHLANFITKRVTNRNPHQNRPIDMETVHSICKLSSDKLRVDVITEPSIVQKLGQVAISAGIDAFKDSEFRQELSTYLKPNSTSSSIGMPGFGFGFPGLLSFAAPALVRFFNMEKSARERNEDLFKRTNALLILSTQDDTKVDWLRVGRVYEQSALLAAQAGMSTSPWAATIQVGEHYRQIQNILGMSERPQFFARLGFPTMPVPHSPRLKANEVTINE